MMIKALSSVTESDAIEAFHLAFLRVTQSRIPYENYVLKGGANLRYYMGSHRYSRDLDFDAGDSQPYKLEEGVDLVLASAALKMVLAAQGLSFDEVHKPKQTDTTQRWKVHLMGPALGGGQVWTKIEFSRREIDTRWVAEQIRMHGSLRGFTNPVAPHYLPAAAAEQKTLALGTRSETRARDVFDLHLLMTTYPNEIELSNLKQDELMAAGERAEEVTFEDFQRQVVDFMDVDVQELYRSPESWRAMQDVVVTGLLTALTGPSTHGTPTPPSSPVVTPQIRERAAEFRRRPTGAPDNDALDRTLFTDAAAAPRAPFATHHRRTMTRAQALGVGL
jgi:predicted nucleotidyltransferase component of viral defense system